MITSAHSQEGISRSYIYAVASKASVNLQVGAEFDYGFDGTFRPVVNRNGRRVESGHLLEFQLRSSFNWTSDSTTISYSLKTKTYNDLVTRDPHAVGAILVLVCLPADQDDWITITEDHTILQKCCYYTRLTGSPIANENSNKLIKIPRVNLLTAENLQKVLQEERDRRERLF
jgi:hypothetical protein